MAYIPCLTASAFCPDRGPCSFHPLSYSSLCSSLAISYPSACLLRAAPESEVVLPWHLRHTVALDVAQAIMHLHTGLPELTAHGNVASSSVTLLRDSATAKVRANQQLPASRAKDAHTPQGPPQLPATRAREAHTPQGLTRPKVRVSPSVARTPPPPYGCQG